MGAGAHSPPVKSLNGEILEEVDSFKYLGSIASNVMSRMNEGAKAQML